MSPMTLNRRGTHWRHSADTMRRTMTHERSFASSDAGRRAQALRDEAQALQRVGRDEQAFELFRQAADCFAADELGPAAAAAWHDLGEGFRQRRGGSRIENLRESERYLRRALASPARNEDLRRRALSLNSLASTLRYLANEPGHDTGGYIREATNHLAEAIALADGFGPMFAHERARFLDTMGNLQMQLGDVEAALRFSRRAVAAAGQRLQIVPEDVEERRVWTMLKCHLARRLVARGRRTDLREACNIAAELRRTGFDSHIDLVGLCEALALRALGGAHDRRRAREVLEATRVEGIPPEHLSEYIDLLAELGRRDLAIDHLRNEQHAAMAARKDAKSDYLADHASARAQRAGRHLAQLHLDDGNALAAFLALENSSGLRYEDALREYACSPNTPYGYALDELEGTYRILSALVDDMAGALAHADAAGQRALLETMANQPLEPRFKEGPSEAVYRACNRLLYETLPSVLTDARSASDPVSRLREFADELAQKAHSVRMALYRHEPDYAKHPGGLGTAVDADDLRRLLNEQEGTVLLRVALSREKLLAVSVVLSHGELCATGRRIEVSRDLLLTTRAAAAKIGEGVQVEDAEAFQRMSDALAAIDLSPLFPAGDLDTLVILPDQRAAMLPLGALGPRGATPIDRFASVTWLPCLGPLRCRQIGRRTRLGQVSLAPHPDTRAAEALASSLQNETLIFGSEATTERLEKAIVDADVVCLYTHGSHGDGGWPKLAMADGEFEMLPLQGPGWIGIERVEVWACESGVDLPSDPRGTFTNEFFGLDGMLLQHGVRSTIGTLWPVIDRVTAGIVARYRRLVGSGVRADRALCAAQRWWLREGVPALLAEFDDPETWRVVLESATMWAGYRFSGVCERRPLRVVGTSARLSATEETTIEVLIAELDETPLPFDEAIEAAIAALDDAVGKGSPSPEQALHIAQLYRARTLASYAHNQLSALAWLHEADRVAAPAERPALVREAARLWLWFGLRETPEAPMLALQGPTPGRQAAMQRAARLLRRLPAGTTAAEDAMLRVLATAEKGEALALAAAVRESCSQLAPSAVHLDIGALAITCWIAAADVEAAGEHVGALIAVLRERVAELSSEPEKIAEASLVSWAGLLLARGLGQPPPIGGIHWSLLPAPMLVANVTARLQELASQRDTAGMAAMREISEALTALEGRLWDHPQRNGEDFWRSTGGTGAAYRRLAGWYMHGVAAHEQPERYVTVFASCLQYFADLRPLVLNRLVHALRVAPGGKGSAREVFGDLAELLSQAERRSSQLEAVALLPDTEGQERMLDPFEMTEDAVSRGFRSIADAPAWELARLAGDGADARSLAFRVVRQLETQRRQAFGLWRSLDQVFHAREHWQLIQPTSDIEANQRLLAELPPATCLLICTITPFQEILLAALWHDNGSLQRRVSRRGEGTGARLRRLVVGLLHPQLGELDGARGPAGTRADLWLELCGLLAPDLAKCLPSGGDGMRLAVFAPGSLRALPWPRIALPGGTLGERFVGVWQLPALGWWPAGASPSGLACWLEAAEEPASTRFGEAVIAGLRARWPPQQVIGGAEDPRREIPEVQQVERAADLGLQRLRIYGVGLAVGVSDSTAGLQLGGERAFIDRNFAGTRFRPGTAVDLWAATPSLADSSRAILEDGDRLPGLVHSLLGAGAIAVLDLAWPVHDFIKAMVCEHYGLLRGTRAIEGAVALANALGWCARLVTSLLTRRQSFADREALLAFVDVERRRAARDLGFDPTVLVALPRAALTGDIGEWLDEVARGSHLAAFRWWGACPLGPVGSLGPG
jgi:hypothetical protein